MCVCGIRFPGSQHCYLYLIYTQRKEQIIVTYSVPKETITIIMMLYKNIKAMVRSPDCDTDFFYNVTGISRGDSLKPCMLIIGLDFILRMLTDQIKNGFTLKTNNKQMISSRNYD